MKLKADFFGDWVNILKNTLSNEWGCNIASVPDSKIPSLYFNTKSRRPDKKPRKVILADNFICPKDLEVGFNKLMDRVKSGKDLTINLSKAVLEIDEKDALLNDWGVHHFHLGKIMNGDFIKRTGPLLYAWLVNENFYVIGIFEHGSWVDRDIVEIMHRNWPADLERYKLSCDIDPTPLTKKQLEDLRKAGVNTISSVKDGTSYLPIGGGFAGQGLNIQSVVQTDHQKDILKDLEYTVTNKLEGYLGLFEKRGYKGDSEIEAVLSIEGGYYVVTFPKYHYSEVYKLR